MKKMNIIFIYLSVYEIIRCFGKLKIYMVNNAHKELGGRNFERNVFVRDFAFQKIDFNISRVCVHLIVSWFDWISVQTTIYFLICAHIIVLTRCRVH